MKQGGDSWNNAPMGKSGVKSRCKCKYCGREYKMEWAKNNHEKGCYLYRKAQGLER